MLQLVYVSSVNPNAPSADPTAILAASRVNNQRDGITGMLYSDKSRFLQALEGPADKVEAAFARIKADTRHRAIVILSNRTIDAREFGDWEMAHRTPGADAELFIARVSRLAGNAAPDVRATFEGFAKVRRAA
ncbi:BLUF domain-containing protein [Sphingomonas sp. LM7]|uniref:BLUF domain-containing protein n=1 Tax=Sphingomonas sp. LM7 TaxID=1938607 RepID=UPI0009839C57|nr:BLUF domain-containing protein [Sphingomonas sp. LM7]AQR72467.1 activator of photopigment and puc with BLUF domain protein [Sphingomonas sp. LM7]